MTWIRNGGCPLPVHVCFWHKADVQTALMNVRFEGTNGHDADVTQGRLMTQSGHCLASRSPVTLLAPREEIILEMALCRSEAG
jgi:hypothetical protein